MNNFKKLTVGLPCVIVLFLLVSFTLKHSSNNKDWIPENFNPINVTLLIQKHPLNEKYNNGMIAFLEREYPWKYEVVTLANLDETKYQDKKMYQFALLWSNKLSSKEIGSTITYRDLEGHFLDRDTDKEYPKSGYALNRGQTAYSKMIRVLVKKFKDGKGDE